MNKKLLFLLVLLLTATTGAWATDYTTLAVGDVIKVGDTFSPTAEGAFNNDFGFHSGETFTLMRADVDNDGNVTEKTDGAYYVFKHVSDFSPYMHFGKAFAVTAISDGLEVTNIETGKEKGNLYYTLAVHEPAAASGYTVSLKDGVKDAGKWTVKAGTDGSFQSLPLKGVKAGTKVKLKYDGDRSMVKGVTAVKKAAAPATITVTWNNNDITGIPGPSFTKDDVTITADMIDFDDKNFMMGGTFTTTLGNFTKIEVTGSKWDASGTGWSGSTWTGNASSVSYNGSIRGDGMGTIKFVFTIEPKKAAYEHSITIAVDPSTTGNIATAPAMTIEFNTGETWADVAARYDWLDTYLTYTVFYKDDTLMGDVHDANGGVKPDDTIDPNGSYHWGI